VADRWLSPTMMLIVIALLLTSGAVGTALLRPDSSPWLLFPVLVIFGASAIGWNGVFLAQVARLAPAGRASVATGGTLCITFFGVVLGPPLFGVLAGMLKSYGASYGVLGLIGLIITVLLLRLRSKAPSASA
ncbi:MAG: MFS transporter, partial [bacterium]